MLDSAAGCDSAGRQEMDRFKNTFAASLAFLSSQLPIFSLNFPTIYSHPALPPTHLLHFRFLLFSFFFNIPQGSVTFKTGKICISGHGTCRLLIGISFLINGDLFSSRFDDKDRCAFVSGSPIRPQWIDCNNNGNLQ